MKQTRWLSEFSCLPEYTRLYLNSLSDPVEMQFPMLQKPLHFYPDKTKAPPELVKANDTLKVADAFLFISCEYNHCIPPALLNLVDHFPGSSFSWRPSGLITYSPGKYIELRSFS